MTHNFTHDYATHGLVKGSLVKGSLVEGCSLTVTGDSLEGGLPEAPAADGVGNQQREVGDR